MSNVWVVRGSVARNWGDVIERLGVDICVPLNVAPTSEHAALRAYEFFNSKRFEFELSGVTGPVKSEVTP